MNAAVESAKEKNLLQAAASAAAAAIDEPTLNGSALHPTHASSIYRISVHSTTGHVSFAAASLFTIGPNLCCSAVAALMPLQPAAAAATAFAAEAAEAEKCAAGKSSGGSCRFDCRNYDDAVDASAR